MYALHSVIRSVSEAPRRRLRAVAADRCRAVLPLFALLWWFVAAVSVHDAALVVLNGDVIREVEQNPLGRWLIDMAAGSVWLFVAVKLFSTGVVCALLASIHEQSRGLGMLVATSLACFQAGLLAFLYLN